MCDGNPCTWQFRKLCQVSVTHEALMKVYSDPCANGFRFGQFSPLFFITNSFMSRFARYNRLGTMLISASLDKTLKLWDIQGNCLKTLAEHSRYVNTVSCNSDSTIIASGSNDRTVIIWDLSGKHTLDSNMVDATSALFNLASNHVDIPLEFLCPITHELMKVPVQASGNLYKRKSIYETIMFAK